MYISKKNREIIKQKFNGKCAYSGTNLEPDWQVEHIKPVRRDWWTNTAVNEEKRLRTRRVVYDRRNLYLKSIREIT